MGQVTLYLDRQTEERMAEEARNAGVSKSRWVSDLIRRRFSDSWPASVVALAGAWADLPSSEELRSVQGDDMPREPL